jgi:hypothetical protein
MGLNPPKKNLIPSQIHQNLPIPRGSQCNRIQLNKIHPGNKKEAFFSTLNRKKNTQGFSLKNKQISINMKIPSRKLNESFGDVTLKELIIMVQGI